MSFQTQFFILLIIHNVISFEAQPSCYYFDSEVEDDQNRSLQIMHRTEYAKDRVCYIDCKGPYACQNLHITTNCWKLQLNCDGEMACTGMTFTFAGCIDGSSTQFCDSVADLEKPASQSDGMPCQPFNDPNGNPSEICEGYFGYSGADDDVVWMYECLDMADCVGNFNTNTPLQQCTSQPQIQPPDDPEGGGGNFGPLLPNCYSESMVTDFCGTDECVGNSASQGCGTGTYCNDNSNLSGMNISHIDCGFPAPSGQDCVVHCLHDLSPSDLYRCFLGISYFPTCVQTPLPSPSPSPDDDEEEIVIIVEYTLPLVADDADTLESQDVDSDKVNQVDYIKVTDTRVMLYFEVTYDNVDKADDGTESLAIATETTDANGRTPFETRVVKKIASVPTSERIRDWDLHVVLFESLIPGDFAKTYIDGANDIISTLASNQLVHVSEKIHGLQFENNGSYVNRHLSIESYGWYGFVFLLGDDTLIQTIEFVGPIENATLRNERSDVETVPTNNASDNNNNNVVLIAVAISSALVLVLIIVGVFSWHKVRKVNKERAEGVMKMELMQLDVKRFQNAWRLDWDQVKLLEKIGQGGAGEVFRGLINQSIPAAIKIMKNSDMKNDMENREIQVLMRIRHKRLVHFLGYGENPEGGIFVGLEMCEFSLDTFCRGGEDTENAKKYMSWPARLQIASDIAEGCTHLHQSGLIHRDLKSGNVLLNRDDKHALRGKVADFGLSKIFESKSDSTSSSSSETFNSRDDTKQDQDPDSSSLQKDTSWSSTSSSHTTGVGSLFWMAPELVVALREDRGVYTPKVDVYAFGIIMHELLTLLRPYSDRNVTFSYKILNAVEKGERPLVGPHTRAKAPETYCDLMETCWHQDAQRRPEFKTVFLRLCKMHSTLLKCSSASSTRSDKESHIDGDV